MVQILYQSLRSYRNDICQFCWKFLYYKQCIAVPSRYLPNFSRFHEMINGFSPAELLMGRKLRSNLPVQPKLLNPKWPSMKKLNAREKNIISWTLKQRFVSKVHWNLYPEH